MKDLTIPDASGPWSPRDGGTSPATKEAPTKTPDEWLTPNPEDLRSILDVLAWITLDTKGKKTTLTKKEVSWILKIAKAAPSAGSRVIWRVVQRYMLAEAKGESTEALDTYLAFKPWESENRFRNYNHLARYGWIKEAPGRHEMDGTYPESEGLGGWYMTPQRDSLLDGDTFRFRQEVHGNPGPSIPDERKRLERIRKWHRSLYDSILEVWDDGCQKHPQAEHDAYERAEQVYGPYVVGKASCEDEENWWEYNRAQEFYKNDAWDKYKRLVEFFGIDDESNLSGRTQEWVEEEFNRIMNAPEEVQDKEEPRKSKKSKREGKK